MPIYIGIDGGGTKTTCAVADESSTLATVTTGPSNVVRVGEAKARESLQQAVRQACAAAGITPQQVARTCVGASGAARPEVAAVVRDSLAEILHSPIDVVGDTEISLEAAFNGGPGVIVIGGTGSIAYGRNAHGKTARAGGLGFAISDEGSAHWIGRTALATLLRDQVFDAAGHDAATAMPMWGRSTRPSHERNERSLSLLSALLNAWKLNSIDQLIRTANASPPPDFAGLFPIVTTAANEGDTIAQEVLTQAGRELARITDAVIRRLFGTVTSVSRPGVVTDARVPVAMVGGVFRHAPQVRDVLYNQLRTLHPTVDMNQQVVDPTIGAVSLARKAAQQSIAAKT